MSDFATARQKMVDGQVRPSDVTDLRIIDAMLAIPREAFVPEALRALAYLDLNLDVSEGGAAKRFLIKPAVLAKMLQAAAIAETDRVLVVGCATGYSEAVIAKLTGQVTATEPGTSPEIGRGTYDVIVLDGATEVVPEQFYQHMGEGGRLVGVFALSYPQRAVIVTHSHGDFGTRDLFDAAVPVLPGLERLPAFVF